MVAANTKKLALVSSNCFADSDVKIKHGKARSIMIWLAPAMFGFFTRP
jgi:hypothetical protein